MANDLVKAVAIHKETFKNCRVYLATKLGKEVVLKLEDAPIAAIIPHYIDYLENVNVSFLEGLCTMYYKIPSANFWVLLQETIVDLFRQIEEGNLEQETPF
jgi:hypothetical protein